MTTKKTLRCKYITVTPNGVDHVRGYTYLRTFGAEAFHEAEHSHMCDRPHPEHTIRPGDWAHGIGRDPLLMPATSPAPF